MAHALVIALPGLVQAFGLSQFFGMLEARLRRAQLALPVVRLMHSESYS